VTSISFEELAADNPPIYDHGYYFPILKGRLGEFEAISHTSVELRQRMTPLMEIVPPSTEDEDPDQVEIAIRKFAERLEQKWPFPERVIVDTGLLNADVTLSGGMLPIQAAASQFHSRGQRVVPVVHLGDRPAVIEAIRDIAFLRDGGVCIRVTVDDFDADLPIDAQLTSAVDDLAIDVASIDLIIDFGAVIDDNAVTLTANLARYVLRSVPQLDDWRSFTLAAGGFPIDLGRFAPGVVGEAPRYEAQLWQAIVDRAGLSRIPSFGDYGIAHPALPQGPGFAPAPQLRYTTERDWRILKGRKNVRRGSAQFYDLCAALVGMDCYAGRDFSWGDTCIADAAASAPEGAHPLRNTGNASTWRAIGTSHHLAFVSRLLASQSET
jgi:hypothetical protein